MTLPLDAKIQVLSQLVDDFIECSTRGAKIPKSKTYNIVSSQGGGMVKQAGRMAAFEAMQHQPLTKLAFDTRRVDQEGSRNPRKNLQYWHRTDPFIDEEDEGTLKNFAKLARVLTNLKKKFGTSPEWFESYARQLYDNVHRVLRVKEGDLDIFRPQLNYLEQLVFARYRLSMENIQKFSEENLADKIISKDEELLGRSAYLKETGSELETTGAISNGVIKDSMTKSTQESIVNAIFGAQGLRRDGERTVERTITIKIVENVVD